MSAPLDLDATSLQRLQEALADLQHGDVASAASAARRLIKQSPLMEPAHVLLARAQRAQGLNKQAVQTCKAALIALPRSTALWTELALGQGDGPARCRILACSGSASVMALNQIDQGRFTDGLARARSLLTLPLTAQQQGMAHHLVAAAPFDAGEAEAAQAHYALAVKLSPQHTAHRSARVATGLYTDLDAGQHNRALAHALLGALNVPATALQVQPWDGQRPLRVGWLSGDFRQHSCAHFLWPLLRHLPASRFEHVAYDTGATTDAWTTRFQSVIPHWRQVASLAPRPLADLIARDRIDVLVDLAGLTTGGRIETLAARPAPLILHWLGYLGTLGLDGLGERISDPWVESAATTCEALWMGVPVVSRVGASVCSRQGRTLLQSVGLPDLACHSEADWVRRCQSLVADPEQLSRLRSGLRSRMANSPLCDGADLAAHFTALLEARLRA